jgi:hypothetical protein
MTLTSKTIESVGCHSHLSESPSTAPARIIDFVEARDQLILDSATITEECEIKPEVEELVIRRERSAELVDALEEAFYWLISTAVVIYLALGVFSL